MSQIITEMRVVPNLVEGARVEGFKVFSIQPNSIFVAAGMRNGDAINHINGIEMNGIDAFLNQWKTWRESEEHRVDLERRRIPIAHHYRIGPLPEEGGSR